jgi:hypothetical protein
VKENCDSEGESCSSTADGDSKVAPACLGNEYVDVDDGGDISVCIEVALSTDWGMTIDAERRIAGGWIYE